jgi:hypothetical protein
MPASPNSVNLHAAFGDTLTYKKVSVPCRWTIVGEVRDKPSHHITPVAGPDMPPSNQVHEINITAETHLKNKTVLTRE